VEPEDVSRHARALEHDRRLIDLSADGARLLAPQKPAPWQARSLLQPAGAKGDAAYFYAANDGYQLAVREGTGSTSSDATRAARAV